MKNNSWKNLRPLYSKEIVVINPQKTLSFNEIVGERNLKRGYKNAKIISKGRFIDAVGGGVCQVSTTLYNASILAGLEILEVNPHSLKVGYVKGSFDAMVSAGISDLVIENDGEYPVFIHTYATNEECGVKIFGLKNEFTIKPRSEKIEFDEEEFPNVFSKTIGYLDYYKDDILIESKKIRKDTYYKAKI